MHLWVFFVRWLVRVLTGTPETYVSGALCRSQGNATIWRYRNPGRQVSWRSDVFGAGRVMVCRLLEKLKKWEGSPGLCRAVAPCGVAAGVACAGQQGRATAVPRRGYPSQHPL
jgi:hypothetical protein